MLAVKSVVTIAKKGCSRRELVGLKRAWPPSIGCGHDKTKALEEAGAAAEEEAGTAGAAEREATCGWDEKSIVERRETVLISLGL
jgi:hypothetical protein